MTRFERKVDELADLIQKLSRIFQHRETEFMHTLETELTLREWNVVVFLGQKQPCIMREIADHLGLPVSSMTGIVDRLVQKGLVERQRPEEDRRIVNVELTEKGHQVERWHFEQHRQISRTILQNLNESDQNALLDLMRKVALSRELPTLNAARR